MLRKIILFVLGVAILVAAIMVAKNFINNRKVPAPRERKIITTIFSQTVQNQDIPINITTNGNLTAKYKVELFSEVQGVFNESSREYKPGMYYKKGDLLIKVNSDEHRANLRAQKSSLYNQIVLLLPDLRLDYPKSFGDWEEYVRSFDIEKPIQAFPTPKSEKEKLFVSGKNAYTTYYTVKNLEERLAKYEIRAPFNGVLTEASLTKGTLIRVGQKLGEFINPNVYELMVPVPVAYSDLVRAGQKVTVNNLEKSKSWDGKIIRINSVVNQGNQSIQVFVEVRGKDLKEGLYLQAELQAREEQNAYEMSRKLLVNDDNIFIVQDSILDMVKINPVYFKENTVVIKGLADGTEILARPLPGAYTGMKVNVIEQMDNPQ